MPDLNTVPASPHVLATTSRRASSQQMPPPPVPNSPSLNILPSNQSIVNQTGSAPSLPSPPPFLPSNMMAGPVLAETASSGPGPGPLRHPRPLTAADLHLQLEKEQEAVVNRLTREISILRAVHNASVVSNSSSTSASASGAESAHITDPSSQHLTSTSGFSHPLPANRRHNRTGSNTSARSFTAAVPVSTTSIPGVSSPAPIRPPVVGSVSMSRQNSAASRRSRTGSPAPSQPASLTQSHLNDPSLTTYFSNRVAAAGTPTSSVLTQPGNSGPTSAPSATPASEVLSPGILPATSRYEETAYYRAELEAVKRENEALKRQVRELERMVRERRASDASRAAAAQGRSGSRSRSESVSTTASVSVAVAGGGASIAGQREERPRVVSMMSQTGSVGVGVPEDEVKVGESAASAGLGGSRASLEASRT